MEAREFANGITRYEKMTNWPFVPLHRSISHAECLQGRRSRMADESRKSNLEGQLEN